jgi:hypothetical protein
MIIGTTHNPIIPATIPIHLPVPPNSTFPATFFAELVPDAEIVGPKFGKGSDVVLAPIL